MIISFFRSLVVARSLRPQRFIQTSSTKMRTLLTTQFIDVLDGGEWIASFLAQRVAHLPMCASRTNGHAAHCSAAG